MVNKLIIYMFGPITAKQRKMVVNSPNVKYNKYTCIEVGNEFGPKARKWWAKNLENYLRDQKFPLSVVYEYAPFAYIANSRQNIEGDEFPNNIYSREYRARQKFIDYMRDKYGK